MLIMHVDRAALHRRDPAIIVERGDSVVLVRARRVEIPGPCAIVQFCPEPTPGAECIDCGAQMQTEGIVIADGKEIR